ncbi:hypothetical protein C8J56DRAFT_887063 [Mycena floridula]|nr:hypothetical protein C8J56DRAFT_887063 [Mycena floridula]
MKASMMIVGVFALSAAALPTSSLVGRAPKGSAGKAAPKPHSALHGVGKAFKQNPDLAVTGVTTLVNGAVALKTGQPMRRDVEEPTLEARLNLGKLVKPAGKILHHIGHSAKKNPDLAVTAASTAVNGAVALKTGQPMRRSVDEPTLEARLNLGKLVKPAGKILHHIGHSAKKNPDLAVTAASTAVNGAVALKTGQPMRRSVDEPTLEARLNLGKLVKPAGKILHHIGHSAKKNPDLAVTAASTAVNGAVALKTGQPMRRSVDEPTLEARLNLGKLVKPAGKILHHIGHSAKKNPDLAVTAASTAVNGAVALKTGQPMRRSVDEPTLEARLNLGKLVKPAGKILHHIGHSAKKNPDLAVTAASTAVNGAVALKTGQPMRRSVEEPTLEARLSLGKLVKPAGKLLRHVGHSAKKNPDLAVTAATTAVNGAVALKSGQPMQQQ